MRPSIDVHYGFDVGINLGQSVFAEAYKLLGFLELSSHLVDAKFIALHLLYDFLEPFYGVFVVHFTHDIIMIECLYMLVAKVLPT